MTINFVLLPTLFKARADDRAMFLCNPSSHTCSAWQPYSGVSPSSVCLGLLARYTQLDLTRLVTSSLALFPRIGIVVLLLVIALMSAAARLP